MRRVTHRARRRRRRSATAGRRGATASPRSPARRASRSISGMPGLAHAKVLRSPYPHARIRVDRRGGRPPPSRRDRRRHRRRTCRTSTSSTATPSPIIPLIATGKVRFAGEPVVGVVAEDPVTAEEALRLIERRLRAAAVHDRAGGRRSPTDAPIIHEQARRAARPSRLRGGHRADPPERLLALAPGLGRHRRRVRSAPTWSSRASTATRARYAYAMEPYNGGRLVGRGRADGLDVRPAPVHGPRGPGPLLRPVAGRGPRHRARTSVAATAASRTRRSSR